MRPFSGASIGSPPSSFDDAKLNTVRRRMDVEAPPNGRAAAAKAAADAALFGLALIAAREAGEAGEDTTYANADSGAAATRKASRAAVLTNIIVAIACDVEAES